MRLIKPFVYSVCDAVYRDLYADAFLNSARHHGHKAEIFCREHENKASFVFWRFELMPELIRQHGRVLMVDIDSIFLKPARIRSDFDLGVFPRITDKKQWTLGGVFYCTSMAADFADDLADKMRASQQSWYLDQEILWNAYCSIGDQYKVRKFDHDFIDWRMPTIASIYTAKGKRKSDDEFLRKVDYWRRRKVKA